MCCTYSCQISQGNPSSMSAYRTCGICIISLGDQSFFIEIVSHTKLQSILLSVSLSLSLCCLLYRYRYSCKIIVLSVKLQSLSLFMIYVKAIQNYSFIGLNRISLCKSDSKLLIYQSESQLLRKSYSKLVIYWSESNFLRKNDSK